MTKVDVCYFTPWRDWTFDVRCWTFIFFHPALAGLSGHCKKFLILFAQDIIGNCLKPILIVSPLTLTDNENSFMLVLIISKPFHSFGLAPCWLGRPWWWRYSLVWGFPVSHAMQLRNSGFVIGHQSWEFTLEIDLFVEKPRYVLQYWVKMMRREWILFPCNSVRLRLGQVGSSLSQKA